MSSTDTTEANAAISIFSILQGTVVEIQKTDGDRIQGLLSKESNFKVLSLISPVQLIPETSAGKQVVLKRKLNNQKIEWDGVKTIEGLWDKKKIEESKQKDGDANQKVDFFKATEHDLPQSNGGGERTLTKMTFSGASMGMDLSLEDDGKQWNQFESNKQFGYQGSTYKDEDYTTTLNYSNVTEEQVRKANKKASEIEAKNRGNHTSAKNMGAGWRMEDNDDEEEHRDVSSKKKQGGKGMPVFHRSTNQITADVEKKRSIQGLNLEAGVSIPNHDEIEKKLMEQNIDRKVETKNMRKFSESYSPEGKQKKPEQKLKVSGKAFTPGGASFISTSQALKTSTEPKSATLKSAPVFVPKGSAVTLKPTQTAFVPKVNTIQKDAKPFVLGSGSATTPPLEDKKKLSLKPGGNSFKPKTATLKPSKAFTPSSVKTVNPEAPAFVPGKAAITAPTPPTAQASSTPTPPNLRFQTPDKFLYQFYDRPQSMMYPQSQ